VFNLTPSATVDEGNNWINLRWGPLSLNYLPAINMAFGPLSLVNPTGTTTLGNYSIASTTSSAYNTGSAAGAPNRDFFGTSRPQGGAFDIGAVEFIAPLAPLVSVTGGPLAFGNVATGTTSAAQTLTLHNTGTATFTINPLVFSSPRYARAAAGGSCGATLAAGATCAINVVFSPTATGLVNATLTITGNVAVTGSPVSLSGTGVAAVIAATLTPTTWSPTQTRNCPGTTPAQILACALDPAQVFTLTNTGNVTLTGIGHGSLSGTNAALFTYRPLLSTCGAVTAGQPVGNTTLAPGGTCFITVQFQPTTATTTGAKSATVSVSDLAGTQTSTLTGTAN
jgi:hypothetical protein